MKQYNLYLTSNKDILVVARNPQTGWQFYSYKNNGHNFYAHFFSENGMNTEVAGFLSETFNVDIDFAIQKKYDLSDPYFELVEDLSALKVNYNFLSYKLDNIDCKDVTLQDYLTKNFNVTFDLIEPSITMKQSANKNLIDSKLSWSMIDDKVHHTFNNYGLSDALYNEIKNSDTFQTIISYINAVDPVSPYKNILLKGPRASGKTTLVQAVAKYYDLPYAVLTATNRKTVDDIGGMLAPNEETTGWKKEEAQLATVLKSGGVAFIDELNMSTYDFQVGGLNSILDGSRFFTFYNEAFKVHGQTIFFAAMNEGYQGNMILNESTESRFLPIYMDKITIEKVAQYQSKELAVDYDDYLSFVSYVDTLSRDLTHTFEEQNTVYPYPPEINPRLVSKIFTMSKTNSFSTIMPLVIRGILSDPCYDKDLVDRFINKNMVDFKAMNTRSFFVDDSFKQVAIDIYNNYLKTSKEPQTTESITQSVKAKTEKNFKSILKTN